jgi:hypothetical protein
MKDIEMKRKEFDNVSGHAATELVIRGRVESVFCPSHLGVSQEEVQKKPQLGTTQ